VLKRRRRSFQRSFQGAMRYDVPDLPVSQFQQLMDVSGGVVQTKIPAYSRLLRAFGKIPRSEFLGMAGPSMQGRDGASTLLGALQRCSHQGYSAVPGSITNSQGRQASQDVAPQGAAIPMYTYPTPKNEHLMGGLIHQHYPALPKSIPKVSKGDQVSPVALQRAEQRLIDKARLHKVGAMIQERQLRRSASADSATQEHADIFGPVAPMEASPLVSIQQLAQPHRAPFGKSHTGIKQVLRGMSSDKLLCDSLPQDLA